jgi:hypothetical protein
VNALAIGAHLTGTVGLAAANRDRIATQPGQARNTAMKSVVPAFGRRITVVAVTALLEATLFAETGFDESARISARPSEALPVALAAGCPAHVADPVMDQPTLPLAPISAVDAQRSELRAWSDTVRPEDSGTWRPPARWR